MSNTEHTATETEATTEREPYELPADTLVGSCIIVNHGRQGRIPLLNTVFDPRDYTHIELETHFNLVIEEHREAFETLNREVIDAGRPLSYLGFNWKVYSNFTGPRAFTPASIRVSVMLEGTIID